MIFNDRRDAGKQLAQQLLKYKGQAVVAGLARGGVVVAAEVAKALSDRLVAIVVRKIGAPGNPELAIGAISEKGEGVFNEDLVKLASPDYLKKEVERQRTLIRERLKLYGQKIDLKDKTVILIDDGIATGASMRVAIQSVRESGAKKIVLAVPVAAPDSLRRLVKEVDEVVCLYSPERFEAVGEFYRDFEQVDDEDVVRLLSEEG